MQGISKNKIRNIVVSGGTRPEMIKLHPVIKELARRDDRFKVTVMKTGQHWDPALTSIWESLPSNVQTIVYERHGITSAQIIGSMMENMETGLSGLNPDMLLVHGDTGSAFAAANAALFHGIQVGHVEAGIRSFDLRSPLPEEGLRRQISHIAALHFAPSPLTRDNLIREGISGEKIFVTGNSVVDSLFNALDLLKIDSNSAELHEKRWNDNQVLVTAHRFENIAHLQQIFTAIKSLAYKFPSHKFVLPLHPSDSVRGIAGSVFKGCNGVEIKDPLSYASFIKTMVESKMLLTDSGSAPEEAITCGVPVVLFRNTTDRPEALMTSSMILASPKENEIVEKTEPILSDRKIWERMARPSLVFGDGKASARIVKYLMYYFGMAENAPAPFVPLGAINIRREAVGLPGFNTIIESADAAKDWMFSSGFHKNTGRVFSGYNEKEQILLPYDSLSTINFIKTSIFLDKYLGFKKGIQKAIMAADWLIENMLVSKAFSNFHPSLIFKNEDSKQNHILHAFDNGEALLALTFLSRFSNDKKYLNIAKSMANDMIDRMMTNRSFFWPEINLNSEELKQKQDRFEAQSINQAKIALGMTDLGMLTNTQSYYDVAVKLSLKLLTSRRLGDEVETTNFLHFIDGFIGVGIRFMNLSKSSKNGSSASIISPFFAPSIENFKWALDNLFISQTGGIANKFMNDQAIAIEKVENIAQVLRLGSLFAALDIISGQHVIGNAEIEKLSALSVSLMRYQSIKEKPSFGGFYYGYNEESEFVRIVDTSTTALAIKALFLYQRIIVEKNRFSLPELIELSV